MHRAMRIAIVGLLVVGGLSSLRALRVRSMDHFIDSQRYEDLYYLPSPPWLKVLSLGYDEAMADLVWMRALIYYGEEFKEKGAVRHVFHYADALLTLDPDFRRAYRWVGMAALYRPQGSDLEEMKRAADYLELGVRRFPDDGELAWDLGATLTYEILPHVEDPAEKEAIRLRGAEHMIAAARLGAGPPWVTLSNLSALTKLGKLEQAARHLEEMYLSVQDPVLREEIRRHLIRLRNESAARATGQALEELRSRWQSEHPELPVELYLLISHDPPVDRTTFLMNGFWRPEPNLVLDDAMEEEMAPPPSTTPAAPLRPGPFR